MMTNNTPEWDKYLKNEGSKPYIRATGTCTCGRKVEFSTGGDNGMGDVKCACGQWYNVSGQALRPPREWGEETGERFDDEGDYIGGGDED